MKNIVKSTSKGQITLPAKWRRNFSTNNFVIQEKGDSLEIKPLILESTKEVEEYTVFDAIRDNEGKGIKAKDLLKIIKKTI
jgi:bifunctional DNA-binding transcriptional regulator/antitoxin component of YhaV-PrlF toxin-antitoxin module